jgi:hypothetical protein
MLKERMKGFFVVNVQEENFPTMDHLAIVSLIDKYLTLLKINLRQQSTSK